MTTRRVIFPEPETWTRNNNPQENNMTDQNNDYDELDQEQIDFNRETSSVALELLEIARRCHNEGGIDMGEAWEGLTSQNPTVVLGACGRVIEATIGLSADGISRQAFNARLGVVRSTFVDLLGMEQ